MTYKVQKYKVRLVRDGVERVVPTGRVTRVGELAEVVATVLRDLPHEEVWVVLANAAFAVTGLVRVSQGGSLASTMTPADVLRPVIAAGAPAFALAHNHPSGDPLPSASDLDMTRALTAAARVLGLTFFDHVIWTPARWESLAEREEME